MFTIEIERDEDELEPQTGGDSPKLKIWNEMKMFDTKNREFYDSLEDWERKKFSPFLMIRWGSTIKTSNSELEEYYLRSTNERLNRDFFDLGKHPKLQWLLATTVSPGMGSFQHEWIKQKKSDSSGNKAKKLVRELYPHLKDDEVELFLRINTDKAALKQLARNHGWTDEQIKACL